MKYIKKMIIDNFQSHQHTELDLNSGLNIIVGQSDKGKSAVIRALKWVLYNEPRGSDFIRYGTNECSVTIVTGDDYIITRKRKTNKNIYTVITPHGEKLEFENFGNDVPLEVYQAAGIKKVKLDTDIDSKLNLNEQLDAPFLLSETGTVRAKTIGRIVNTNILDAAERDIQKDISNNNVTLKGYEKQLSDIENELAHYSDIFEQEEKIKRLEGLFATFQKANKTVEIFNQYVSRLENINQSIDRISNIIKNLKVLPSLIDEYTEIKEKYTLFQRLHNYKSKINAVNDELSKDAGILKKLQNLKLLSETANILSSKFDSQNKLKRTSEKYLHINSQIDKSKSLLQIYNTANEAETSIKELVSKKLLQEKLCNLCSKQTEINQSISKGTLYLQELNKELKNRINIYSQKLKQIGKCPTCYCQINNSTISHIICELEGELNANN